MCYIYSIATRNEGMKMTTQIKHRFTDAVLFEQEGSGMSLRDTLESAVRAGTNLDGANLDGANLRGANLRGANLDGANLRGANLDGANLYGANLDGANLYGANLYGADLRGANLYGANLDGANLYGADLYGADLRGANLYGANLDGANLRGANLDGANLYGEILKRTPLTVTGLRWFVLITGGFLRIGCQRHSHADWANFSDEQIAQMDSHASAFWTTWKAPLLSMCAAHAAQGQPA
jgi:uncharacterized protein YjbI with pentapeptide repeats